MVQKKKRILAQEPPSGRFSVSEGRKAAMLFSFEFLQPKPYGWEDLKNQQKEKAAVAEAIYRRAALSVQELRSTDRTTLGIEQIPFGSLKGVSKPSHLAPDADKAAVMRIGQLGRFVGHIRSNVFYVLWVDLKFKLYKH